MSCLIKGTVSIAIGSFHLNLDTNGLCVVLMRAIFIDGEKPVETLALDHVSDWARIDGKMMKMMRRYDPNAAGAV